MKFVCSIDWQRAKKSVKFGIVCVCLSTVEPDGDGLGVDGPPAGEVAALESRTSGEGAVRAVRRMADETPTSQGSF